MLIPAIILKSLLMNDREAREVSKSQQIAIHHGSADVMNNALAGGHRNIRLFSSTEEDRIIRTKLAQLQEILSSSADGAVPATLKWYSDGNHEILITAIKDGRVFFRNSWGSDHICAPPVGLRDTRSYQLHGNGIESLPADEFAARCHLAVADKGYSGKNLPAHDPAPPADAAVGAQADASGSASPDRLQLVGVEGERGRLGTASKFFMAMVLNKLGIGDTSLVTRWAKEAQDTCRLRHVPYEELLHSGMKILSEVKDSDLIFEAFTSMEIR